MQLCQLGGAVLHQIELAVDVAQCLLQQLTTTIRVDIVATQLSPHGSSSLLGCK
jgi:hypothetical protein